MKHKEMAKLMGQVVTVSKRLIKNKNHTTGEVAWSTYKVVKPRSGWVVGFRFLQNGCITRDYDENYFEWSSSVLCMLVTCWPNQKPVNVPMDGFELGGEPNNKTSFSEAQRKLLREEMKDWPRDDRGRWLPKGSK